MELRNKVEKKKKKKKMKRGFLVVLKHSVTHSHFHLLLNQIISITNPPIPPKYLSLIVDERTNTHLPHSYLSYKSTTIHVLTRIQITPKLLILLFQNNALNLLPSLPQNNHFPCESSKSISSSLLSHSSHWIQECE